MATIHTIVEFPVTVNEAPMTAEVLEEVENPMDHAFRIRFSDGFTDIFYYTEDGVVGERSDKAASYAKALNGDFPQLVTLDTMEFYHIFPYEIEGQPTNVWVTAEVSASGEPYYAVRYNQQYRFELRRRSDEWIASTKSLMIPTFDEALATQVKLLLEALV